VANFPNRRPLGGIVALVWLAVIVSVYYISHKPLSPQTAGSIAATVGQFLTAAAITSIAGGIGARWLKIDSLHPLAILSIQTAWGLGVSSLLILAIGLVFGFGPWQLGGLLFLLAITHWRNVWIWVTSWQALTILWQGRGLLARALGLGSALILLASLGMALAPPVKFDALVYHLALPRYYLNTGGLVPWEGAWFWGMPQTGEMLYAWAMALAGDRAAACLGWLMGFLALVGLWGFSFQYFGRRSAWVAIAALLSGITLSTGLASAYVDWLAILYGATGLILIHAWLEDERSGNLAAAGVLAGMAIGVKYTAGIFLVPAVGVICWRHLRTNNGSRSLARSLLSFLIPAALLTAPWLLKNVLFTGNPLYPFLFASEGVSRFRLDFYQLSTWGDWRDVVFLPIRATMAGIEGTPGYSATVGPLLLALAPLAFLKWRKFDLRQREILTCCAVLGLGGLAIWAIASRFSELLVQSRLYFVIFPAFALLSAGGYLALEKLKWPGVRLTRVGGALIVLVYALSVFPVMAKAVEMGVLPVILAITPQEVYQDDNLGWYAPAMRSLGELEPSSKVMMLWEPRGYTCLPVCIPDEVLDRWISTRYTFGDPEVISQHWQKIGITHVLYNRFGAAFVRGQDQRYKPDDWNTLEALLSRLELVKDFGGAYLLYRLAP